MAFRRWPWASAKAATSCSASATRPAIRGLALNTETEIIADTTTYGTRQSNKKDGDGGGAIYGCRSNPGNEPCIRANNLKGGRSFEFVTIGKEGGRIEVGGDKTGAPLTTNATGVATGFNADKVDGKEAADFAPATSSRSRPSPTRAAPPSRRPPARRPPTVTLATVSDNSRLHGRLQARRQQVLVHGRPGRLGERRHARRVAAVGGQVEPGRINWGNDGADADPRPDAWLVPRSGDLLTLTDRFARRSEFG